MYKYGEKSLSRLDTCRSTVQVVMRVAIKIMDIKILDGRRNQEQQDKAYAAGYSKKQWPLSTHNVPPPKLSPAWDCCPYPIDWEDREQFTVMAGIIIGIGAVMGITIRWGGNWAMSNRLSENVFDDLGHFEIVDEKRS